MLIGFTVPAIAQQLREGPDFTVVTPAQPAASTGTVEVLEFFSYGCPHCYAFHPHLKEWTKQLPKNAALTRVPVAMGRPQWGVLSRAYYALEATGDLARLDDAVFAAIHERKTPLFSETAVTDWVVQQGVDRAKFTAAYNSQAVSSKVLRAEQLSRDFKVGGVPQLTVGGKYVVVGEDAKTLEDLLVIARKLIGKAATGS